ncbi:MAG: RpiB/LacA/LacB family sugar-phosphate isomerase [Patescibacteria group bacterium]|nr:RpiB/LacA/LacB family sugar-phosphate isomerase [Patescibacteria group bacterium]MCL5093685.1 RpiB/LacA/LacB family sugar-phosphate isomerase [Patescibacteria group bacterium]
MQKEKLNIAIGSDESSEICNLVLKYLDENHYSYQKFGALKKGDDSNWVKIGHKVAAKVAAKEFDQGILLCWTGTGISIVANKTKGIRAALCFDKGVAEGARKWNDANILAISNGYTEKKKLKSILDAWFLTKPSKIVEEKQDIERIKKL